MNKVECAFPVVVVCLLPHAEFGRNDHREDAPHFNKPNKNLEDNPVFMLLAYVSASILERKYFVQSRSLSALLMNFEIVPKHAV